MKSVLKHGKHTYTHDSNLQDCDWKTHTFLSWYIFHCFFSFLQYPSIEVHLWAKTLVSALIKRALLLRAWIQITQIWPQVTSETSVESGHGSGASCYPEMLCVFSFSLTAEPSRSGKELTGLQEDERKEHVGLGSVTSWHTGGVGGVRSSKREQCLWRLERLLGTGTGVLSSSSSSSWPFIKSNTN